MIVRMLRLAVIAIALCGCRDKQVEQVQAIRDEVCACSDAKCGEDAMKRLPTYQGTPAHRVQMLASEMVTCMSKLYLKDRPDESADPVVEIPTTLP